MQKEGDSLVFTNHTIGTVNPAMLNLQKWVMPSAESLERRRSEAGRPP
jgi:hypothetical protein